MNLFSRRPAVDAMAVAIYAQAITAVVVFGGMIWIISGACK